MADPTPYIGLHRPDRGDFPGTWDVPANGNADTIDAQFYLRRHWKASVATFGDLPGASNEVGDKRQVLSTNTIYYWNGSAWLPLPAISMQRYFLVVDPDATENVTGFLYKTAQAAFDHAYTTGSPYYGTWTIFFSTNASSIFSMETWDVHQLPLTLIAANSKVQLYYVQLTNVNYYSNEYPRVLTLKGFYTRNLRVYEGEVRFVDCHTEWDTWYPFGGPGPGDLQKLTLYFDGGLYHATDAHVVRYGRGPMEVFHRNNTMRLTNTAGIVYQDSVDGTKYVRVHHDNTVFEHSGVGPNVCVIAPGLHNETSFMHIHNSSWRLLDAYALWGPPQAVLVISGGPVKLVNTSLSGCDVQLNADAVFQNDSQTIGPQENRLLFDTGPGPFEEEPFILSGYEEYGFRMVYDGPTQWLTTLKVGVHTYTPGMDLMVIVAHLNSSGLPQSLAGAAQTSHHVLSEADLKELTLTLEQPYLLQKGQSYCVYFYVAGTGSISFPQGPATGFNTGIKYESFVWSALVSNPDCQLWFATDEPNSSPVIEFVQNDNVRVRHTGIWHKLVTSAGDTDVVYPTTNGLSAGVALFDEIMAVHITPAETSTPWACGHTTTSPDLRAITITHDDASAGKKFYVTVFGYRTLGTLGQFVTEGGAGLVDEYGNPLVG